MAANARFFKWVWEHKPHYCECCMRPLPEYSATYCSHILTRGAHPEMAHDPRNINILCFGHHNQWEHETTRKGMRIYPANILRIQELKKDYARKICKECGNCYFFVNGEDYDFCGLNDKPVECYDNACEDFEER